jgi:hypothetical protein
MDIITTSHGIELLLRWLHFMAGITWIGLLYYINFVQTPFFGTELGGQARSAMVRGLVPNVLWWFRWGAMFTFLSGLAIVALRWGHGEILGSPRMTAVLTGGAMGTLMWANVWFVIWPAQQIAIASANAVAAGGEADPQAAALAPRAARASRTNTLVPLRHRWGRDGLLGHGAGGDPAGRGQRHGLLVAAAQAAQHRVGHALLRVRPDAGALRAPAGDRQVAGTRLRLEPGRQRVAEASDRARYRCGAGTAPAAGRLRQLGPSGPEAASQRGIGLAK